MMSIGTHNTAGELHWFLNRARPIPVGCIR